LCIFVKNKGMIRRSLFSDLIEHLPKKERIQQILFVLKSTP